MKAPTHRCSFCHYYGGKFEGSAPAVLSHARDKKHNVNALNCVEPIPTETKEKAA